MSASPENSKSPDNPTSPEQISIRQGLQNADVMTAALALYENRLEVAEPLLRRHLKSDPFDVAAIRMLAEVAARIGRYRDSETLRRRASGRRAPISPACFTSSIARKRR